MKERSQPGQPFQTDITQEDMHRTLRNCFVILALLVVSTLSSCAGNPDENKPNYSDPLGFAKIAPNAPLKLGVIQSFSGKVAPLGKEQMRGLELALARRNGKLLGHEVKLLVEDSGCQPEGGANAALRIVADPEVVAIFGTTCSSDAATASEVMSRAGLCMISGNNSAAYLTSIGGKKARHWQPGYFRTAPNEEFSGPAAATYAYEKLGIRKAATVNDGDIYTSGLTEGFEHKFKALGGKIVLSGTVNKNDTNMGPLLRAVENSEAELIFFPLFQPEGNLLLLQARKRPALKKTVFMSDGSLIEESFIASVKEAAIGMYFIGPTPPAKSPALDGLLLEYRKRNNAEPSTYYYTSAYDAAELLFTAIEKAAREDKRGFLYIGRQTLRDTLRATRDHQGVGGRLTCNEFGDCASASFNVLRLKDPAAGVEGLKSNIQYTYSPAP